MGFYETIGEVYTAEGRDFGLMVDDLLQKSAGNGTVARMIFFGKPDNNEVYIKRLNIIRQKIKELYKEQMPVVSYVAQRPLDGDFVLEVYKIQPNPKVEIEYCDTGLLNYLKVEDSDHSALI